MITYGEHCVEAHVSVTAAAAGLLLKADNETCYLRLQAGGPGPCISLDLLLLLGLSPFDFTRVLTFICSH